MQQMVAYHKFSVISPPSPGDESSLEAAREKWANDLAGRLTELSREAKLGIVLTVGDTVIVGELAGYIGMEIDVPQLAVPVGMKLPGQPGGNRRQ